MATSRNEDAPVSPIGTRSTPDEERTNQERKSSVTSPIEAMIRQIGIDKVYGSPIRDGDTTVVPVAELRTGFGFGSGSGPDAGQESRGEGGGAGLRMTPRGYIEITADGVRYRSIYDLKTFVIGGAFVGWLVYRLLKR